MSTAVDSGSAPAAAAAEKTPVVEHPSTYEPASAKDAVRDIKSPGVARITAISKCLTTFDRIFIFFGVFLLAYVYGLDGTLRYVYQPTAFATFDTHSLISTLGVLRAVIGAAAQPTAAKIADVFGRVELVLVSVFFYVIGTIVESAAKNMATFVAGAVLYQIGYTMIIFLVEVIIADITSTRTRLFFSYIPATPFIINTWVSGDVSEAVLSNTTWRWGVAMWCIIYPVCAMPLVLGLILVGRRARKQGHLENYRSSFQVLGARNFAIELFWLLDVIGIILLIAVFALILAPLTLAGGFYSKWGSAHIIAPLVVGVLCIPVFIVWEMRAPHPLVPFKLMKDRSVWAPMGIAFFLNFAWYMQADYLYTVLIVAFDFSVKTATRVTSLYSFVSVIVGTILGLVVYKVRRLKMFIVAGTCLSMVAFGLLIHYRGTPSSNGRVGVIAAQVVLGAAGGFFPYPAQASLQSYLVHENLAVMTGVYLATYNIGSALGNAVSGAMWTQILPKKLGSELNGLNSTLAVSAYGDPFTAIASYPVGTPERTGIIAAYQGIQRLLTITGICLTVPLIVFAMFTRNPKLNDAQTLAREPDSETDAGSDRVEHDDKKTAAV